MVYPCLSCLSWHGVAAAPLRFVAGHRQKRPAGPSSSICNFEHGAATLGFIVEWTVGSRIE